MAASKIAVDQYVSTSDKLAARVAILSYDSNPKNWWSWQEDQLGVSGDVLEIGGGTGELWRHIDHSKARLTLTDFSPAMCDKLRDLRIEGSTVKQCDAADLPFEDASFDVVIANHMLYHLDNPDTGIKEFARVLRPGGKLKTALNRRTHIEELINLGTAIGRPSQILNTAKITAETAPEYLAKHFEDVEAIRFPGDFVVSTVDPVLAYLGSWGDEPLSEEQVAKVRAVVEPEIAEKGRFKIRKEMVLLSARKA
ncbi:hypothetical protein EG328_000749 [Venturia inaequalis]|uniref:Methyltransferase type 11 domain-containing protein n=1 Tax=Venturia inaequalis TaxID=5025 RepID=A0A8H3UQI2_VENIN|nr:hypothetical protein EG327_009100 [Venturia inaequalis]KAE9979699.1 hypothetical protein EG328_000749 [Venturia inaequalis]RDI81288.1 hypothetical protein Vi05172_g8839 [Venturia inaequalis]